MKFALPTGRDMGKAARFLGRSLAIGAIELSVTARFAPLRQIVRAVKTKELHKLASHFDREIYLRQIRSIQRRRRAAVDPLLHYLLIGWRELRSPNLRFDPVYRGDDMRAGPDRGEPLLHLLSMSDGQNVPQNEIEEARGATVTDSPPDGTALIFHHSRGGGSSKFLKIFEEELRRCGVEPLRLRLLAKSDRLVIWPSHEPEAFDIIDDMRSFIAKARSERITHIVISHVADFDGALVFERLDELIRALDVQVWVILHDYLCLCPRVNLVNDKGHPCEIPSPLDCSTCVAKAGSEIGSGDPMRWRAQFLRLLDRAERILVPSQDTRERIYPFISKPIEIWRPQDDIGYPAERRPTLGRGEKLSVAILGGLNEAKGSRVVLKLARLVKERHAPLQIDVYGETDITRKLQRADVIVRGRYRDREIGASLREAAPHIIFIPAIWPETWSFILTTALEHGFAVTAFAHGAQSERLRNLDRASMLMPIDWFDRPDLILGRLLEFRDECVATAAMPITTNR